jgi:LemA protein
MEEKKFFTKKRIIWGIVGVFALILCMSGCSKFNSIDKAEESIDEKWGMVETQYQRRLDLIPNLVEVVKGYVDHENSTLVGVIEARSKATSIQIDPTNASAEDFAKLSQVQGDLTQALSKLMMLTENYPDLKANEQFKMLQTEIAGTENRIAVARDNFNKSVKFYNNKLRGVSGRIWGRKIFGFETRNYFESEEGAEKAPKVKF